MLRHSLAEATGEGRQLLGWKHRLSWAAAVPRKWGHVSIPRAQEPQAQDRLCPPQPRLVSGRFESCPRGWQEMREGPSPASFPPASPFCFLIPSCLSLSLGTKLFPVGIKCPPGQQGKKVHMGERRGCRGSPPRPWPFPIPSPASCCPAGIPALPQAFSLASVSVSDSLSLSVSPTNTPASAS